jgi:hypothetical protein
MPTKDFFRIVPEDNVSPCANESKGSNGTEKMRKPRISEFYNKSCQNFKMATINVKNMHICKTEALKRRYTQLSLDDWRQPGNDNETPMTDVFEKSYVLSTKHSCFR